MKKLLMLAGLLLSISFVGNIVGYRYAYRAFDRYNDTRIDPTGTFFQQGPCPLDSLWDVVLLGDSHAKNWRYPGNSLNLGIPSQTSSQIKLRSDAYKSHLQGNLLIIIAGANDLNCITTNRARKEEIVKNCLSCLSAVIDNHRDNFRDICISTVVPEFRPQFEYRFLHCKEMDEALDEMNTGIRSLAKGKGIRLLDSYAILEPRMNTEDLSSDGIHLNQKAYEYLYSEMDKQVKNTSDIRRDE